MGRILPGTITSVADFLEAMAKIGSLKIKEKREHAYLRYWFRGHSNSTWKLSPGVFRDDFVSKAENRLKKEMHLNQDFRVNSASLRTGHEKDVELYFLQQHYGMPTRLLDWSTSALVGLYFATNEALTCDGRFYMMDAFNFCNQPEGERGIATSRRASLNAAIKIINDWKHNDAFPDHVIAVRPDHFDGRMGLQKSCFTFQGGKISELTQKENPTLEDCIIPSANKLQISNELSLLGIDAFTIYGDLENLAKKLKQSYADF